MSDQKKFWAYGNHYDSETDGGFANTDFATFFSTKEARDSWVNNSRHRGRGIGGRAVQRAKKRMADGVPYMIEAEGKPIAFQW